MRNLKVIGKALLDVYDNMFSLLLMNLIWIALAALPIGAMTSTLQTASEDLAMVAGVPVMLFVLALALVLLSSPAHYALAVMARKVAEYESVSVRDFLGAMRQHVRRAWLMGLVAVVGTALVLMNLSFYMTVGGWGPALVPFFLLITAVWFLIVLYLFPMAVITEGGPLRVLRNSVIVIMRYPGLSIATGVMALLLIGLSSVLIIPWVIITMSALTALGTRAVRSAVRRDFNLPEEEPIADEPLPPILPDVRPSLPHYGWRNARREGDDEAAEDRRSGGAEEQGSRDSVGSRQ